MAKIKQLEQNVYQKIAAGEVIERPASVVKELVENSLDAGAKVIEVRTEDGGKTSITVMDNGEGFHEEDIELAFKRHTTSKLSELSDFDQLQTLGFRGEALPSILSVAKVELKTAANSQGNGLKCNLINNRMKSKTTIAWQQGTSIQINDLFYNFPVRRKFLKSERTELKQITTFLEQMALAHFQVSFTMINNNRTIFKYSSASSLAERIYQVFGKEFLEAMQELSVKLGHYQLNGFISKSGSGFPSKKHQYFFVNGRAVREKVLIAAVNNTFQKFLEKGRHPACILLFNIPPEEIDVNIHPMKLEIKFQNSSNVYQFIAGAINQINIPEYTIGGKTASHYPQSYTRQSNPNFREAEEMEAEQSALFQSIPNDDKEFQVMGQFLKSYIIVEKEDQLLIVDQHNAQERILFDKLKDQYSENKIATISPLFPIVIDLSPSEMTALDQEKINIFSSFGFRLNILSGNSVDIKEFPEIVPEKEVRNVFLALLHLPQDEVNFTDKVIATIACKKAIKVGQKLFRPEMEALVEELFATSNPNFCPHQRPIIFSLSQRDIERGVKRK
jgi:DNA mismatch repair protein MutL